MATLDFNAMLAAVEKNPGVEIKALDGKTVILRRFENLPRKDFKLVLKYMSILQDEQVNQEDKMDAMDACLIAAADKKDSLKESLEKMPIGSRNEVFEVWMTEDEELGNS
ncbi:hypothetical protein ACFY0N_30765 [Streptomyces vinaceus]|uniref:hypothetical protein n=1 Tax=Streptomyces vinaceus TaxID=1960 RepID=UPI00367865F4